MSWLDDGDKRPQRFGWAPGDYLCICRKCASNGGKDRQFTGDKRAIMCADCAYARQSPADTKVAPSIPQPAENPLRKAVEAAIDSLGNWLVDNVPEGENWEDAQPEIDAIRTDLQVALDHL